MLETAEVHRAALEQRAILGDNLRRVHCSRAGMIERPVRPAETDRLVVQQHLYAVDHEGADAEPLAVLREELVPVADTDRAEVELGPIQIPQLELVESRLPRRSDAAIGVWKRLADEREQGRVRALRVRDHDLDRDRGGLGPLVGQRERDINRDPAQTEVDRTRDLVVLNREGRVLPERDSAHEPSGRPPREDLVGGLSARSCAGQRLLRPAVVDLDREKVESPGLDLLGDVDLEGGVPALVCTGFNAVHENTAAVVHRPEPEHIPAVGSALPHHDGPAVPRLAEVREPRVQRPVVRDGHRVPPRVLDGLAPVPTVRRTVPAVLFARPERIDRENPIRVEIGALGQPAGHRCRQQ